MYKRQRYHNCDNGRVKIWVAPAAMWSNTRETLKMLWKVTNEYKSGFTVHISETEFDREAAKGIHGKWDIDAMIDMGICGPNVLMVHCVHPVSYTHLAWSASVIMMMLPVLLFIMGQETLEQGIAASGIKE